MYAKIKTILLPVLLALAIVSLLTVSLTLGRYTEERGSEGQYSGDLEYIVSNQVEINKVDEFFSAIENGYSNIKIADDVDNPLIISGGISDVNSDLVIDLNGHEIQRNNREPLLNVTQGVRLTIIDTSKEQTGCFYNPVGSVLQISGGTLTVSAGVFESGPRSGEEGAALSEYYGSGENGKDTQQGARIDASRTDVTFFESDTDTGTAGRMPVIYPSVVTSSAGENAKRSANGNIYFGTDYGAAGLTRPVSADTYLYFTVDDPTVEKSTLAAPGSADYFYTYYLDKSLTVYQGTDASEADDILITVYVYNDVKGSAQSSDFSAIGMKKGNLYVRGGTYRSYFGEENTYCVDASGGYMAIESGSFYAYGSGVCVQCAYENVDTEKEYLRVSNGTFYSEIGNTIGVSGGRMVVSAASFTKNALGSTKTAAQNANGSAIYVSGGSLSVSASSTIRFSLYGAAMNGISAASGAVVNVKNVEMDFYSDSLSSTLPGSTSYNFGIYSSGGSVTCDGTTAFHVIGSHSSGIYSNGGTVNIDGDSFTCSVAMDGGDKILSSTAISAVGGDINFNVAQADIRSNGLGITVGGGNIQFAHNTKETINITTTRGTAIFAYGGKVSVDRNSTLSVKSTIADGCVWAADTSGGTSGGTDTGVNVNNGIYLLGGSFDSKGTLEITHTGVPNAAGSDSKIRSYAVRVDGGDLSGGSGTMSSFAAKKLTIQVMDHGGGLYVNGGSITLGEENSAEGDEAVITARGYGIAMRGAEGDSVTVYGTLTLTSECTTGIYITGGSLTLNGEANIISSIDAAYTFVSGAPGTVSYDGVFVEGGTLMAYGIFNVSHTGISNPSRVTGADYEFLGHEITSYAVRVTEKENSLQDSNVTVCRGKIENSVGGGVYVSGGTVVLGNQGDDHTALTVTTNGTELYDEEKNVANQPGWKYFLSEEGGHAVEVKGGNLTVNSGTYTAKQGNGILVRNFTSKSQNSVTINNGEFYGYNAGYNLQDDERKVGPAASAGLYVMGNNLTVNIYGGTFGKKTDTSNSAAAFFGTPVSDNTKRAEVNILGGAFYGYRSDVMSVFRFVNLTIGQEGGSNAAIVLQNAGQDESAALSIQDDFFYTYGYRNRGSQVMIRSGTLTGTGMAIYFGSSAETVKLSGGIFETAKYNGQPLTGTYYYGESYILVTGYKFDKSADGRTWTVIPSSS